jgi:hypothetical protein
MQYFGILASIFALLAYAEILSLKKRVATLEAAGKGGPSA